MEQTFRCPECGAEFPTQHALEEHVAKEHMGTQTKDTQEHCPACSMEFRTDDSLKDHEKTHQAASTG